MTPLAPYDPSEGDGVRRALRPYADRLEANAEVFRHLVAGVDEAQARWKPSAAEWSLLEVTCHLADEERDDFRRRLDLTLHHTGEPWPPIDPPRWAVERAYNERTPTEALEDFLRERARSVEWLRELGEVATDAAYEHPSLGRITAGDLLASWLAHDILHVRQMARLHHGHLVHRTSPEAVSYAGPW